MTNEVYDFNYYPNVRRIVLIVILTLFVCVGLLGLGAFSDTFYNMTKGIYLLYWSLAGAGLSGACLIILRVYYNCTKKGKGTFGNNYVRIEMGNSIHLFEYDDILLVSSKYVSEDTVWWIIELKNGHKIIICIHEDASKPDVSASKFFTLLNEKRNLYEGELIAYEKGDYVSAIPKATNESVYFIKFSDEIQKRNSIMVKVSFFLCVISLILAAFFIDTHLSTIAVAFFLMSLAGVWWGGGRHATRYVRMKFDFDKGIFYHRTPFIGSTRYPEHKYHPFDIEADFGDIVNVVEHSHNEIIIHLNSSKNNWQSLSKHVICTDNLDARHYDIFQIFVSIVEINKSLRN